MTEWVDRLRSSWKLKIVLSLGLNILFLLCYVLPQRFPVFSAHVLEPGWLDRMIPFVPGTVWIYESLWLLLPVAPWLMTERSELMEYARGLAFQCAVAFCFFFFWPTAIVRPTDLSGAGELYQHLIRVDGVLNAFPSLHASFALFHAAHFHRMFRTRGKGMVTGLFWLWALAITFSTLPTRQHVAVDLLAGAALGFGAYFIFSRSRRSRAGR